MRTVALTLILALSACSGSTDTSLNTPTCTNPFSAFTGSCAEAGASTDDSTPADAASDVQNDAPFDANAPPGHDAGMDGQEHDASAPDASIPDAPVTCTTPDAALGNCPSTGGDFAVSIPTTYCMRTPQGYGNAEPTPQECKCIETFNCACLAIHATNSGCGSNNPATCSDSTGTPIVKCGN